MISPYKKQTQMQSFKMAFHGLAVLIKNERNFRIHLVLAFLVLAASALLGVSTTDWILVLLLIGVVLSAEAINTCVEYICDLVSPEYHPLVKKIKDIAAGVVVLNAIIAVVGGCVIFIPYLIRLFV